MEYKQNKRIKQQDFEPNSIKPRVLPLNEILKNTQTDLITVALPNGSTLTLTSTIASSNAQARVGVLPYAVTFFEGALNTDNWIPFGSAVSFSDYEIFGPLASAQFTPQGSTGNDVVYKTALKNNSGSDQTIYVLTDSRYLEGSTPSPGVVSS